MTHHVPPLSVMILAGCLQLVMMMLIIGFIIVSVKNALKGASPLSFPPLGGTSLRGTGSKVLKFVYFPLIIRCTLIWVGLWGVLFLCFLRGKVLIVLPFFVILGLIISWLSIAIFLLLNSAVSVLLSLTGVRSPIGVTLALLPLPMIAFIAPYDYLFHNFRLGLGEKGMENLGLCVVGLPAVFYWGWGVWKKLRLEATFQRHHDA